jgi:uncharacterized small protein (TIGR04563 family)
VTSGEFELLGHYAPFGYPGVVVPIARVDGKLVAAQISQTRGVVFEALAPESEYVGHDAQLTAQLRSFDPSRDRLWAFTCDDVRQYDVDGQRQFFQSLLASSAAALENPFLRFALSKLTLDLRLVREQTTSCLAALAHDARLQHAWKGSVLDPTLDEFEARQLAGAALRRSRGLDRRKQSLYFPESMLTALQKEAARLDRSVSWVVQRCVKIALRDLHKLPSATSSEEPGEDEKSNKA